MIRHNLLFVIICIVWFFYGGVLSKRKEKKSSTSVLKKTNGIISSGTNEAPKISKRLSDKTRKTGSSKKKKKKRKNDKSQKTIIEDESRFDISLTALMNFLDPMNDIDEIRVAKERLPVESGNILIDEVIASAYLSLHSNDLIKAKSILIKVVELLSTTYVENNSKSKGNLEIDLTSAYLGLVEVYKREGLVEETLSLYNSWIEVNSSSQDAFIQRGEYLSRIGRIEEALVDSNAVLLKNPQHFSARLLRGKLNAIRGIFSKSLEDFNQLLASSGSYPLQETYYFLCETYFLKGSVSEARKCVSRGLSVYQNYKPLWIISIRISISCGHWQDALQAMDRITSYDRLDPDVLYLQAELFRSLGRPLASLSNINELLLLTPTQAPSLELIRMKATTLQSLGRFSEAMEAFSSALSIFPGSGVIFYDREICAYLWMHMDTPHSKFNIQSDIPPAIRSGYLNGQQSLDDLLKSGYESFMKRMSPVTDRRPSADMTLSTHTLFLLNATKQMGRWVQLDCEGFMPSVRQHRQFGLAALEMAQSLRKHVRALNGNTAGKDTVKGVGLCVPNTSSSRLAAAWTAAQTKGCPRDHHIFSYRDFLDIAIRWRQLSDPHDAVYWFEFKPKSEVGFMLSTHMLQGEMLVTRYASNIPLALKVLANHIKHRYFTGDDVFEKNPQTLNSTQLLRLQRIEKNLSVESLCDVIGTGFWAYVDVESVESGGVGVGEPLEGTRIVLTKVEPSGHSFTIKTPSSTERLAAFESVLETVFQSLVDTLSSSSGGKGMAASDKRRKEALQHQALQLFFYWCHLTPLTRGTAATGYAALLASLLAGGYVIGRRMPHRRQLDWEAILTSDPAVFLSESLEWVEPLVRAPFDQTVLNGELGFSVAEVINTPAKLLAAVSKLSEGEDEEFPFIHGERLLDKEFEAYLSPTHVVDTSRIYHEL